MTLFKQTKPFAWLSSISAAVMLTSLSMSAQAEVLDYIVATVNSEVVLNSELEAAVADRRSRLMAEGQPVPDSEMLRAQTLELLVQRGAQVSLIQSAKARVDNTMVNQALQKLALQRGVQTLGDLQAMVERESPGSYARLREITREEIAAEQLKAQELGRRVNVSDQDIDYFLASPESQTLYGAKYNTDHFRVYLPSDASPAQERSALAKAQQLRSAMISGADVDQLLSDFQSDSLPVQGGNMGFHEPSSLPGYAKDQILALNTAGQVTQPVRAPDGFHVIRLKDKQDKVQKVEPQWQVQHILVSPSETLSPQQARERINEIYGALQNGENFDTLASTYSNDPGSASKGGSLGWVSQGVMVKPFEDRMLSTPAGQITAPFETQFGWHVMRVNDTRQQDVTQKLMREQAKKVLTERLSQQAAEDWLQELNAQSYVRTFEPPAN